MPTEFILESRPTLHAQQFGPGYWRLPCRTGRIAILPSHSDEIAIRLGKMRRGDGFSANGKWCSMRAIPIIDQVFVIDTLDD